ncbi:MAG: GDYXXLXY domain-containing protein [Bacteroidota bacterium]
MSIQRDLSDLIKAEVITQETADKIRVYYNNKGGSSANRLFIVFGILGAILTWLGITLIIAHNWDDLSRGTKTIFAFVPLLAAQVVCGYTLMKRQSSIAWQESSSAFLFFAVGASIALVSQIYNHDFIKAKVSYISEDGSNELAIEYSFDRYYMEESKAQDAEQKYRQSLQVPNRMTYALVRIKDGDAVLKDIIIDGASIGKLVKKNQEIKK